jgi:acetylglutamate kinase
MILHRSDHAATIHALRNASPYIRLYKGKVFVVKAGGAVFGDAALTRALIEQIAILHYLGVRVVMVHGGGPQLTELTDALGVSTRMVQGRRVTDESSIDAISMVLNGLINTRILAICRDLEIDAVGLSGVDAGLVRAHRRPPMQLPGEAAPVDFGLVGDIDSIDAGVIRKHLDNGLMPVISPLSADNRGTLLNINADTVAAAIGGALSAEKLVLCTGAQGILERADDPGSVV